MRKKQCKEVESVLNSFNLTPPPGIESTLTKGVIDKIKKTKPKKGVGFTSPSAGITTVPNTLFIEYIGINTLPPSPPGVLNNPISTGCTHLYVYGESYFDGDVTIGPGPFPEVTPVGLVLTSPNGTPYRILVSDSGSLETQLVTDENSLCSDGQYNELTTPPIPPSP